MKKTLFFALFSIAQFSYGQTEVTFENYGLNAGEFIKDAGMEGGFSVGNLFLPNTYFPSFEGFSGWAISATTDVTTPGYTNDLSAITGGGYNGSTTYAVSYLSGGMGTMHLTGEAAGGQVSGMYITNGTYGYLSMLEGDSFAKKFGGETGDDPDFFLLTVSGYENGELKNNTVELYLADYRFEDNGQDYIVNEWTWLDLTSLGNIDSLHFELTSSDVGMSGMNTPSYICVDNVVTTDMPTGLTQLIHADEFSIYPNPVAEFVQVEWKNKSEANLVVRQIAGQEVARFRLVKGTNSFELNSLSEGLYIFEIQRKNRTASQLIFKK